MNAIVTSIPSPGSGTLHVGPLALNAYGLMIALGVLAGISLAGRRFAARGIGDRDTMTSIAMWAVPAGVIGGRLYHVVTDWERFSDDLGSIVKVWEGGLGVWGGIALGVVVGLWRAKVMKLHVPSALVCVTPALPLAQAIGRWGNWFNQELFGRPTDLPWALEVSARTAEKAGYSPGTTFHPTFLYESLACLLLCVLLLQIDKRRNPRVPRLFYLYVIGYCVLRFFIEGLRIDPAHSAGGLRLNQWVSIVCALIAALLLIPRDRRVAQQEIQASSD